jgi:16S rRNA (adenine(1408)-N(1))-methyltransferase
MGTGDGRAVLAAAARDPNGLVIGVDPVAQAMAEASRRAARAAARGGLPNALFVAASAESIPVELHGIAAQVTVRFPWAALLRGCLGSDPAVARGLACLLDPGGTLELLLAPAARDRLDGLPTDPVAVMAAARTTFEGLGLVTLEGREATADEVRSAGSTWAKRLLGANGRGGVGPSGAMGPGGGAGVSAGRPVVLVRFRSP